MPPVKSQCAWAASDIKGSGHSISSSPRSHHMLTFLLKHGPRAELLAQLPETLFLRLKLLFCVDYKHNQR